MKKCRYVFVCMGKDCKKAGSMKLKKMIKANLKEYSGEEKIKIIKTECMDHCKAGPNIIFKEKMYKHVTEMDHLEEAFKNLSSIE